MRTNISFYFQLLCYHCHKGSFSDDLPLFIENLIHYPKVQFQVVKVQLFIVYSGLYGLVLVEFLVCAKCF